MIFFEGLTQNITLNPNMTYFKQQDTSLWSRLLRFDLWPLWWWFPLDVWWEGIFEVLRIPSISLNSAIPSFLAAPHQLIWIKSKSKLRSKFSLLCSYVIVFSVARLLKDSWLRRLSHSCIRGSIQGFYCSRLNYNMHTHGMKTETDSWVSSCISSRQNDSVSSLFTVLIIQDYILNICI